ncbi:MAG: response regulator transcription factor [Myxococcota bacterium]
MQSERHSVVLVDDHPVFRAGLRAVLSSDPSLEVVGEATHYDEGIDLVERFDPNLILLDLSLPGKGGLELLREVRARNGDTEVLVLSTHDPLLFARRCLKEGARGYLQKQEAADEVVLAAQTVLRGEVYLSPSLATQLVEGLSSSPNTSPFANLSNRELNVMELLGRGQKSKDIAQQLNISVKTVDAHLANIKRKLGLPDGRQLLRRAIAWVEGF